jgi:hypothetical protein
MYAANLISSMAGGLAISEPSFLPMQENVLLLLVVIYMSPSRPGHNSDRPNDGPYLTMLWRICRHTCFILLGMGLALSMASILGYQYNAARFLVYFWPMIIKTLFLLFGLAFVLIFIESLKGE